MSARGCHYCGEACGAASELCAPCELNIVKLALKDAQAERDEARAVNHRALMKLAENVRMREALEEIAGMCSENASQMQAIAQDALGWLPPSNLPYIASAGTIAKANDLTPGVVCASWLANPEEGDYASITDGNGHEIAMAYSWVVARLAAEAPTLLALLRECLANSPGRTSDWRTRVEDSIARAEGKS